MRLDPRFRFALYAAFFALFITGVGWLLADKMKQAADEAWQTASAYLLMIHGGAAMAALMMFGALVPLHIQRGWRAQRNRAMGAVMLTCSAVL